MNIGIKGTVDTLYSESGKNVHYMEFLHCTQQIDTAIVQPLYSLKTVMQISLQPLTAHCH